MQYTTAEIMGGLGNQLFQIFAILAYSLKNKSLFYFSNNPIHHGQRKKTYWDTALLQNLKPFVKAPPKNNEPRILPELGFHYHALPFYDEGHIRLFGYFQSFKYFQEEQEKIYRLLNIQECQEKIREKTATSAANAANAYNNTIALHFRVGDYKNLPNHHPIMSLEYYTKALRQFLKDTTTTSHDPHPILYFCEKADQDYVETKFITPLKENPEFKDKFTFQCIDHDLSDWEQMMTMSLCKYFIIANSTFSWWGAYFGGSIKSSIQKATNNNNNDNDNDNNNDNNNDNDNNNEKHYVYYPSTWFGTAMGYKNMSDFFPPNWHKINV